MKKIITIILCLSVLPLTFAQTEQADAEFLSIKKEYTLNEDGSIDFHYSKELKLLSYYAFHRLYGETFILHNTDFQTLKINTAYTIMADGKKIVTPDNAFNEVLPRFSNNAPAYNHIREMVVTHTGLEVGAVIHLDYTIHTDKGFFPDLMFTEMLNESSPVKQLEIVVNIPESKNINYKLLNTAAEPNISTNKGVKKHSWTFNNLPASSKDYFQVKNHLDAPQLLVSSAEDFKTAYNQFLYQDGFNLEIDVCLDKILGEKNCSAMDPLSTALSLQKVVSNDLGKLNIPLKYSGFKFRSPAETWKSNQGTQIEKTVLLSAMLNKAAIKATPVAFIPDEVYSQQLGNLEIFSEFAVMIEPEGFEPMLISADQIDNQSLAYNLKGKHIIKLDNKIDNPDIIINSDKSSSILVKGILNFKAEGPLTGRINMVLNGNANPYFKIYRDASAVKSILKEGVGTKDIKSFRNVQLTQDASHFQLEVEKTEPLKVLNKYYSFDIPTANMGVDSWHMTLLPANRNVSLEIKESIHERYEYLMSITDGLKPVVNPVDIEIRNNVGYIHIKFEIDNDQLNIIREIKLDKKIIAPSEYNSFKAIMDAWNKDIYSRIIFKKS